MIKEPKVLWFIKKFPDEKLKKDSEKKDDTAVIMNLNSQTLEAVKVEGLKSITHAQFSYCQTPSGRVFVHGGDTQWQSLHEILMQEKEPAPKDDYNWDDEHPKKVEKDSYKVVRRASSTYRRSLHSMCVVGETMLVVTGTFSKFGEGKRCEIYDTERDEWREIKQLNWGRRRHSSCSFRARFVYVFGGWDGKSYINSLEKYDTQTNDKW